MTTRPMSHMQLGLEGWITDEALAGEQCGWCDAYLDADQIVIVGEGCGYDKPYCSRRCAQDALAERDGEY